MDAKEWYKGWFNSPYYHKLYFERDEAEAEGFIKKIIAYLEPPKESRVVDIACGKGRHSKLLSDFGLDVTGIDISTDSIQYANRFSNDHLNFYVHDMRLLFWINYFDYAFNFFTSFGYFNTRREHDDTMRTIAAGLKPGGILLLDYLNVHYAEEHLIHNENKNVNGTDYEIHRWHDATHFYKKIIVSDAALEKPVEYTEQVAKFSLGDFTDMLSFQKMQVTEVFGDYELNKYDVSKTPRMILISKKME